MGTRTGEVAPGNDSKTPELKYARVGAWRRARCQFGEGDIRRGSRKAHRGKSHPALGNAANAAKMAPVGYGGARPRPRPIWLTFSFELAQGACEGVFNRRQGIALVGPRGAPCRHLQTRKSQINTFFFLYSRWNTKTGVQLSVSSTFEPRCLHSIFR